MRWLVLSLYFGCLLVLSAYGAHRWYLLWLYRRHRGDGATPLRRFEELPRLTVQLPLYNEMYVAERLIDAICALDYPRERLEREFHHPRFVAEMTRRLKFDRMHANRFLDSQM